MKRAAAAWISVALAFGAVSCKSAETKERERAEKRAERERHEAEETARMRAAIPADSPLAKVEVGMTESEVGSILGSPTSVDSHITGKQFIPFNYAAKDTVRMVHYYKGVGRVEFSYGSWGQRHGVVKMIHDPDEPGFKRRDD